MGYYGGVNYGFGYDGFGFHGHGYSHVDERRVHNVYREERDEPHTEHAGVTRTAHQSREGHAQPRARK